MKVLVSFLGTGRLKKDEQDTYQETSYVFPDGEKYITTLATAPLVKRLTPQKVIFVGTPKSMWPALDELLKLEGRDLKDEGLHEKVFEETLSDKGINEDTLKQWEAYLTKELRYEIVLKLIKDENDLEKIVEHLYYEVPEGSDDIFLEITHSFRHFPLIGAFTVPILRLLKGVGKISFIYGLFGGKESNIMFLDEVNKLIKLFEAVALSEYGGNFSKFSEVFGNLSEIEDLYVTSSPQ